MKQVAAAVQSVGGLFVLDCIASGTMWVDMQAIGIDILISAPQKGWSASPCAGLVMLNDRARERVMASTSSSFACDLKKWLEIMAAYQAGGHAYHATMPTDALRRFRDVMLETEAYGFDRLRASQRSLGQKVRALMAGRQFRSVAAEGFEAPGVAVFYTDDPEIQNGRKFAAKGMQIAAGVPLQCDEGEDYHTFRLGLFGLDKLQDVDGAVARLEAVLRDIL
jgi:aspartate aminotransferase-like enzyme